MAIKKTHIAGKVAVYLAVFVTLALNIYIAYKLFASGYTTIFDQFGNPITVEKQAQIVDYKDFISIMLTGLAIMVTILGIGLAVAGVWGYANIKEEAIAAAREAAVSPARDAAREVAEPIAARTALEVFGLDSTSPDQNENKDNDPEGVAEAMGEEG
ncbi:hypothetical protein [Hansschlegelia zhihuaiae]|uniref:Uncharacterized protein n=1 Tax=Hansschlegelia zhihuaiae TaxID=405005 RepID=A0A4Q0M304_9HYPH|nr:hypothetical protein [Hansschlegelia zhihuaiae]RXF67113.1 hypothetical protein EK403_21705 [Hansschlegelia zhihuaiae]